jgi:hypothetical protein
MNLQPDQLADIVGNATAPAFLLAAVGMQLRVLNNRMARIVDRRQYLEQFEPSARNLEVRHELEVLAKRWRVMNRAILLSCLAAVCVAALIASLFLDNVMTTELSLVVAGLFSASMLCMVLSYLLFLDEIFLSIRKLKLTIRGSRHLPHQPRDLGSDA